MHGIIYQATEVYHKNHTNAIPIIKFQHKCHWAYMKPPESGWSTRNGRKQVSATNITESCRLPGVWYISLLCKIFQTYTVYHELWHTPKRVSSAQIWNCNWMLFATLFLISNILFVLLWKQKHCQKENLW